MVWYKQKSPFGRSNGSAVATIEMAKSFAATYDIHLVSLGRRSSADETPPDSIEPFKSETVVVPNHAKSALHRVALLGWYVALHISGLRSLSDSVDGWRAAREAVARRVQTTGASVVLSEYLSTRRVVSNVGECVRIIRLMDVDWQNLMEESVGRGVLKRIWLRRTAHIIRAKVGSLNADVDHVLFVSEEDRIEFLKLGISGHVIPVSVPNVRISKTVHEDHGFRLVFLGGLNWWPNLDGLKWFIREVLPTVRSAIPEVELTVIGTVAATFALPKDPKVHLIGHVDSLHEELCKADLGVIPVAGGTGVKIKALDMLSVGLPIVAFRNGVRGTSGVRAGAIIVDDADDFAQAIVSLLRSRKDREKLGNSGLAGVTEFHSGGTVTSQLSQLLNA